jgi:hypothetical protein
MGWQKREVNANLVIIGDGEGNVKSAAGLLAGVTKDPRYPDNRRYELVQKDGTSKSLAGSASINSQLGIDDVGKFVKLTFDGWGASGNGKFKKVDVQVYEGEVTPEMKAWPRYAELHGNGAPKAQESLDERPASLDEEDDDLPF